MLGRYTTGAGCTWRRGPALRPFVWQVENITRGVNPMSGLAGPPGESNPGTHWRRARKRGSSPGALRTLATLPCHWKLCSTPDRTRTGTLQIENLTSIIHLDRGGVGFGAGNRPEGRSSGEAKFVSFTVEFASISGAMRETLHGGSAPVKSARASRAGVEPATSTRGRPDPKLSQLSLSGKEELMLLGLTVLAQDRMTLEADERHEGVGGAETSLGLLLPLLTLGGHRVGKGSARGAAVAVSKKQLHGCFLSGFNVRPGASCIVGCVVLRTGFEPALPR